MRTSFQSSPSELTATECEDGHKGVRSTSSDGWLPKAPCSRVAYPTSSKNCIPFEVSLLREGISTVPPFSPTMSINYIH